MTEQEKLFTMAVAAMIGLVSRGATEAEVRDRVWQYAEFALSNEPKEQQDD